MDMEFMDCVVWDWCLLVNSSRRLLLCCFLLTKEFYLLDFVAFQGAIGLVCRFVFLKALMVTDTPWLFSLLFLFLCKSPV